MNRQTKASFTYTLLPNFNGIFDYFKNEQYSEYIFDIEHEKDFGGLGSNFTNQFMSNATQLIRHHHWLQEVYLCGPSAFNADAQKNNPSLFLQKQRIQLD